LLFWGFLHPAKICYALRRRLAVLRNFCYVIFESRMGNFLSKRGKNGRFS
jgi:hypothetical protein